ncbi:MAG: hypothetical protein SYR96_31705, partial [Actinomycetota bacterium]|nr:hypothetical protein [Actinomycetota bacterium]
ATPGQTNAAGATPVRTPPPEAAPDHTAAGLTPERVHAWCRENLPRHAWPRYITVLESLPRNGSGKVSKPALRDPAVVAAAADLEHLRRTASGGKDPQ